MFTIVRMHHGTNFPYVRIDNAIPISTQPNVNTANPTTVIPPHKSETRIDAPITVRITVPKQAAMVRKPIPSTAMAIRASSVEIAAMAPLPMPRITGNKTKTRSSGRRILRHVHTLSVPVPLSVHDRHRFFVCFPPALPEDLSVLPPGTQAPGNAHPQTHSR